MAICTRCGSPVDEAGRFCMACGTPRGAPPAAPPPAGVGKFEANSVLALTMVGGVCLVAGWALWTPLSMPAQVLGYAIPPGDCTMVALSSTSMYFCSAEVALRVLAGPIAVMVALFLFRKSLAASLKKITPRIPADFRFLLAPLVATLCFTMSWAGVHAATASGIGILPQEAFPCVVGLFTFIVARFGGQIQDRYNSFFAFVHGIPKFLRIAAAMLLPMAIGFLITLQERVSQTAFKEQFVVLVCLICGYVATAPRQTARPAPPNLRAAGGY